MQRSSQLTGSRKSYREPPSAVVSVAVAVAVVFGTVAASVAVSNPGAVAAFVAGAVTATVAFLALQRRSGRNAFDRVLSGLGARST